MKVLQEFRSYTDFTEEDEAMLRTLWPLIEPHAEEIVSAFYARILAHDSTREILGDKEQIERLKKTLATWLGELFNGPRDQEYANGRRRIGMAHVRVGVDILVMSMAMSAMQRMVNKLIAPHVEDPFLAFEAVRKATMLDLGLMTNDYQTLHEELRLRHARALLIANLPATAFLVLPDGLVLSATAGSSWLCDVSNLKRGRTHYRDLLPQSLVDGVRLDKFIDRALSTGNDVRLPRVDVEIDDTTYHLSITIVPYSDPEHGVIVYFENHTVPVEAERRMQQAEHLASIGTLSATIAHELRNPLAGISGALQVITGSFEVGDKRREIITKILDQVRSLNWMVNDLLAFARADKLQTQQGIDLGAVCALVIENLKEDFQDVEATIEGEASASADPNMLRQIILNLALNAAQAMGGKGQLLFQVSPEGITVCDSGPGLPSALKKKAFEPFFTTKLKGTGLGLPISRKLAQAMGGDLTQSEINPLGGACFTLVLRRNGPSAAS